jgi:hypothetical protein
MDVVDCPVERATGGPHDCDDESRVYETISRLEQCSTLGASAD